MSLKVSIQTRDEDLLKKTVAKAVKAYKAELPDEQNVCTVHGDVPFSMVFDEDTKWNVITAAYVQVVQAVSRVPANLDLDTETAKIIATNAVLRNVGVTTPTSGGLL